VHLVRSGRFATVVLTICIRVCTESSQSKPSKRVVSWSSSSSMRPLHHLACCRMAHASQRANITCLNANNSKQTNTALPLSNVLAKDVFAIGFVADLTELDAIA